jgi:hypothetical protein
MIEERGLRGLTARVAQGLQGAQEERLALCLGEVAEASRDLTFPNERGEYERERDGCQQEREGKPPRCLRGLAHVLGLLARKAAWSPAHLG